MKIARAAQILVEEAAPLKIGQKQSVFVNRMVMRFFSVPAALSALADIGIIKEDDSEEGPVTIQLDFQRLPEDVIPQIVNLIAPPGPMKMTKYVKNGQARNGFEFQLRAQDFPGDDYDYASS